MRQQFASSDFAGRGALKLASVLIYILIIAGLTAYALLRPNNYWDMLAYIGVVESWHSSDPHVIHDVAYSSVQGLPEYKSLVGIDPVSKYNQRVAADSFDFVQQLPIYSIKPLYCMILAALHRGGLSYTTALNLISAGSFVGLALLAWFWFHQYLDEWWCTVFATLLVVSPPIYTAGRFATPDALELVLVIFGLYMMLEHSYTAAGGVFLILAVWARPDAMIVVGVIFFTLLYLKIIDYWEWGTFGLLTLFTYGVIRVFGGPYSWGIFFYHAFVGVLTEPANMVVHVTPRMFLMISAQNGWTLVKSTSIALVFFMGVLAIGLHRRRSYRFITAAVLMSEILHFLPFPSYSNRFYMVSTFFAPLSLVLACSGSLLKKPEAPEEGYSESSTNV